MKNDFTNEDKLVLRFQSHIETDKQGHPVAHIEGGKSHYLPISNIKLRRSYPPIIIKKKFLKISIVL